MLPQSHFLVAFLFGLIGMRFGNLSLMQAFIAGIVGILIDLDHLFTFFIRHHEFDLKKSWNAAVIHHEHERTTIHRWPGFIVVSLLLIVLGNFYLNIGLILAIGYYTHFFLDHIHVNTKKKLILRGYGFVMKLFYFELILQTICLILIAFLFFY